MRPWRMMVRSWLKVSSSVWPEAESRRRKAAPMRKKAVAKRRRPRQLMGGSEPGFCLREGDSFGGVSDESDMEAFLEGLPKRGAAQRESEWEVGTPLAAGLVVSVHDVCPSWQAVCQHIVEELGEVGVGRVSLLVVPWRHGLGKERGFEQPGFVRWLGHLAGCGHELVLHGYFHRAEGEGRGLRGWRRLVGTRYTAGEGEFFDLGEEEALRRMERGREEMEAAVGRRVAGFVAPAWLLGEGAWGAVRRAGFEYTTTLTGVVDLVRGRVWRGRTLCWSARSGWRRMCSLGWNRALLGWLGCEPLVRVAVHPADWRYPELRGQILELAGSALEGRRALTYGEWLTCQRAVCEEA